MAKGSAGDIATLGVAAIAIYFIYGLIKGNGSDATPVVANGIAISANVNPEVFTPAPAPILNDPVQTKEEGNALAGVLQTVFPTPVLATPPDLKHSAGAIASDAVSTAGSLWGDLQAAGLPF